MIINGNDPDYTANGIALLWENPDLSMSVPTGYFVEVNVNEYTSLFVEAMFSTRTQTAFGVINITKDMWADDDSGDDSGDDDNTSGFIPPLYPIELPIPLVESINVYKYACGMRVSNDGITFGGGSVIPYRIYGSYYV